MPEMIPLLYQRFFYNRYHRWYWVFRLDFLSKRPWISVHFFRHENCCWDLNRLLKETTAKVNNA